LEQPEAVNEEQAEVATEEPPLIADPVPPAVLKTPSEGLEPIPQVPKRVIIVGGGVAGLVAAFELLRQGHDPLILEAQNRVGGRIYTLRDFAPGLYAEAGAMRIPRVHDLTLEYCRLFGLELRPFVMGNPKSLVYLEGQRLTMGEADAEPGRLPFDLAEHELGRTYTEMWDEATREVRELYDRVGEAALQQVIADYDRYSIREFLLMRGFSEGAIELYGVMSFREANLNAAVIEQLREIIGQAFYDMQEVVGGMDRLTDAFYQPLKRNIRFGARAVAFEQGEDSVTVHYTTKSGRFSETGDYAVCTLPFSVLGDLDATPEWSHGKRKAIRELNYNASTKILFQTRTRFWETMDGIVGGTTATDLPIRRMVYPSHSNPEEARGTLLASYTWGQDALRWEAMDPETRIEEALQQVAKIHPEVLDQFEVGISHAWYEDHYARGAFALFEPGQESLLQADIQRSEGRVYFAGEHCSLWHAWIQGALESGIRAARQIHEAPVPVTAR
jgi:monoamine oxidase